MIDESSLLGYPLLFKNRINIYPPKVKDIIENKNFNFYISIFTKSQEEIEDDLLEKDPTLKEFPTPFNYMMILASNSKELQDIIREAFYSFTHEKVNFLFKRNLIFIGDLEEELKKAKSVDDLFFIDENNFFDFQNTIRLSLGYKTIELPKENEDPRIKKIKAKARLRDRIKRKKGIGVSLSTSLISICCMGIGLTPLNIGEITYACVGEIIRHYQEKEKYDIDIRSLLAGADKKKITLKYWIRNLKD